MGNECIEISVPTDNDGYILLQCSYCGEYFKIKPEDIEDDRILEIHCPFCGLCSENYYTEDVIELAQAMAQNMVMDLVHNNLKKLERKFKGGIASFKVNQKPKHKPENPIWAGIQTLTVTEFICCKRSAKINPMLRITGCNCPFCGVKEYELE